MHRRTARLALAGILFTALIVACSNPAPPPTPIAQSTAVGNGGEADAGTPGGEITAGPTPIPTPTPFKPELVLCTSGEPDRLIGSSTRTAWAIRQAVLPSAVSFGDDYTAEPVLLERLPSIADGTLVPNDDGTVTITLSYRTGLMWSDGTPFSAADALLGLKIPAAPFESGFNIVSAEQINDRTLEVVVEREGLEYPYVPPQPPLPSHVLTESDVANSAAEYFRQVNPSLGSYTLTEWAPGSHILLQANQYSVEPPAISVVRVRFITDANQLTAELASGGCDVALDAGVTLDQMAALTAARDSGQVRIDQSSGNVYEQIVFNTFADPGAQVPYFADSRVRQAFAWAMDRATLIQQDLMGLSPLMQSWLPPEHWASAPSDRLTQYGYDLSTAGALLESAGWSDLDGDDIREYHGSGGTYDCQRGAWSIPEGAVFRPTLITSDLPARLQVADKLRANLRQVGVDLQVQSMPASDLFAAGGPLSSRSFDLALYSAVVRPDPGGVNLWLGSNMYLHPVDMTPVHQWELEERWRTSEQLVEILALNNIPGAENDFRGQNLSGWCHEAANVAIVNAARSFEIADRQAAYAEQQSLWSADVPAMPLFVRPHIAAHRPYVCGIVLGPYDVITWNLGAWYFDETGRCGA